MKYITEIGDREFIIEIIDEQHVLINNVAHEIDFEAIREQLAFSMLVDGQSYEINIYRENEGWEVLLRGRQYSVNVEDERERRLKAAAGNSTIRKGAFHLQSPMPGQVVDIPVQKGQEVEEGDVLLILESMKMQNELRSPRSGRVSRILVNPHENVEQRQTLLSVE